MMDFPETPQSPREPDDNSSDGPPQPDSQPSSSQPDPSTQPEPPTPVSEPEPTSQIPDGLEPPQGLQPSQGIQPPQGMQAPGSFEPQQQFGQDQQQYQPDQQQFGQPAQDSSPQQFAQQTQQFGQPADAGQQQFPQDPAQQFQQQPYGAPQQPGAPVPPGPPQQGAPGAPGGPKKGLPTGALIGIIAGAVVLVLLIVGGIFLASSLFKGGSSSASGDEETGVKAATATEAVQQYFDALIEGDADTARKITGGATSDSLLTSEVLEKSQELAPISNVVIDEDPIEGDYDATVSVTFDIGDKTIKRDFKLYNYSNRWELSDGLINLSTNQFTGLGLKVNGVAPNNDYAKAFPGAYELALDEEAFEVSGDAEFFVLGTDDDAQAMYEVEPVLTEEATETFRTLVRKSLDDCLALKTLATPCGLDISKEFNDGSMAVDGTVTRTLTADGEATIKSLEPQTDYDKRTLVYAYGYIDIDIEADFQKDGATSHGSVLFGGDLLDPYVDFSAEKPEVEWR